MTFFVGLDLGQTRDYSALAVLEVEGFRPDRILKIRHLQQWKLGTSYPQICEETCLLLKREHLKFAPLICDATGCGRPVVDLLKQSIVRSRLHAVTITGGIVESKESKEGVTYW